MDRLLSSSSSCLQVGLKHLWCWGAHFWPREPGPLSMPLSLDHLSPPVSCGLCLRQLWGWGLVDDPGLICLSPDPCLRPDPLPPNSARVHRNQFSRLVELCAGAGGARCGLLPGVVRLRYRGPRVKAQPSTFTRRGVCARPSSTLMGCGGDGPASPLQAGALEKGLWNASWGRGRPGQRGGHGLHTQICVGSQPYRRLCAPG